jgi:hypothetical protein
VLSEFKAVIRSLARSPGYSLVVVATLALGIGAAAAAYSSVAGSLFPNMPFTKPEELVRIEISPIPSGPSCCVSWPTETPPRSPAWRAAPTTR